MKLDFALIIGRAGSRHGRIVRPMV